MEIFASLGIMGRMLSHTVYGAASACPSPRRSIWWVSLPAFVTADGAEDELEEFEKGRAWGGVRDRLDFSLTPHAGDLES